MRKRDWQTLGLVILCCWVPTPLVMLVLSVAYGPDERNLGLELIFGIVQVCVGLLAAGWLMNRLDQKGQRGTP